MSDDKKLSSRPKRGKVVPPEPGTDLTPSGSRGDKVEGAWFKEFTLDTPLERITEGPHKAKLLMLVDRVAALTAAGMDRKHIAIELNIDDESVDKILHRPECTDRVRKIGESAVSFAKTKIRRNIAQLADEAMRVIALHLKEKDSLKAVEIALKIMGFDEVDKDKDNKPTSMTVILPGSAPGQSEKVKISSKN